jgi:hypothetical protein
MGYHLVQILVPLFFFLFVAVVSLGPAWLRSKERMALMDTARKAVERGETVPPELIEALKPERPTPSPQRDLRTGAVLIAVAIAVAVMGVMVSLQDETVVYPLFGAAAFPGLIGVVYLLFGLLNRDKPAA